MCTGFDSAMDLASFPEFWEIVNERGLSDKYRMFDKTLRDRIIRDMNPLLDQEYGPIKESPSRGEGKPLTKEQIDSRRDFISSNF